MSQLPPLNLLREEDFPDQRDWIGRLFFALNPTLTALEQILNGGITPSDNLLVYDFTLDFTYSSSSQFPQAFRNGLSVRPKGLLILSALEDGVPVSICNPPWQLNAQGSISITELSKIVSGAVAPLAEGSRYIIQFRLTP